MKMIGPQGKRVLLLLVKILIVGGAFYFMYKQLTDNPKLDWNQFMEVVVAKTSVWAVLVLLVLTFLNRFVEILKWQNLGGLLRKLSVWEATKQVLSALTLGIFTPNGIGEYAGKALYFDRKDSGRVVFLNLICNGSQMFYTILIGIGGFLYLNAQYDVVGWNNVLLFFTGLVVLILLLLFSKKITIKGYSLQLLVDKINEIPKKVHQKNLLMALLRYLCFSHQYLLLYRMFDVDTPYVTLMAGVTAVYFLSSSLPTFQFLDFAVKGSVSVFILSFIGIDEWIVIFISTLIWFLNIVLPVCLGSIFVFLYKPKWQNATD